MVLAARRVAQLFLVTVFMLSLTVALFMVTSPAFADTVNTTPVSPVTISQLTPQQVAGLIGAVIPLLVSLLARSGASSQVKVWINLALTAAVGAVSALVVPVDGGGAEFGWVPFLLAWLYAFISSTIAYIGALQHFQVNDLILSIGGIFGQKAPEPVGDHEVPDPPIDPPAPPAV